MKKIICGELFDPDSGMTEKNQAVFVEEGRIVKVVPAKEAEGADEVIDLGSEFVMPGLVDSHVHMRLEGLSGYEASRYTLTLGDLAYICQESAMKDLMAGFTTLRDEGCIGFVDVALKRAIACGRTKGPRLFVSGFPLTATGGHSDTRLSPYVFGTWGITSCTVDGPDECRKAVRYNFKYGTDQIKIMATGGVMSAGDSLDGTEFTDEEMEAIVETVKSQGRISSAHAHGAAGIKMAVRHGVDTIEHGTLVDDEGIEMMVKAGTYLIPTVIAGDSIRCMGTAGGLTAETVAKCEDALSKQADNLTKCRKSGVKMVFGTDAGTPGNEHGKQTREFELMQNAGGWSVTELLQCATKTPAEMMRKAGQIGSVEPGAFADLIGMKVSPYVTIKALQDVSFVMKNGEIYKNQ